MYLLQQRCDDCQAAIARSSILHKIGFQGIAEQLDSFGERLIHGGEQPSVEEIQEVFQSFTDVLNTSLTRFAEHTDAVLGFIDEVAESLRSGQQERTGRQRHR